MRVACQPGEPRSPVECDAQAERHGLPRQAFEQVARGRRGVRGAGVNRGRGHLAWWTFLTHRLSGVLLAFFLPLHFWFLGSALQGEAALDARLRWTEQPLVIAGEWALVILLAAHFACGLRLLALEMLPWRSWQKTLATLAAAFALAAGLAFALAR